SAPTLTAPARSAAPTSNYRVRITGRIGSPRRQQARERSVIEREGSEQRREPSCALVDIEISDSIVGRRHRVRYLLVVVEELCDALRDFVYPAGSSQPDAVPFVGHFDNSGHSVSDARSPERHRFFESVRIELRKRCENEDLKVRDRFQCLNVAKSTEETYALGNAQRMCQSLQWDSFRPITDHGQFEKRPPLAHQSERAKRMIDGLVRGEGTHDADLFFESGRLARPPMPDS